MRDDTPTRTPNDLALMEWRRASLQEAAAFKAYDERRISATELVRELRRAEQTRLKCTPYLPKNDDDDR